MSGPRQEGSGSGKRKHTESTKERVLRREIGGDRDEEWAPLIKRDFVWIKHSKGNKLADLVQPAKSSPVSGYASGSVLEMSQAASWFPYSFTVAKINVLKLHT